MAETNLKLSKNWTYVEDPSPLGYHAMCSEVQLLGFRKISLSPSSGRHSWISQDGGSNHLQNVATNIPIQTASNSKTLKCSLTVLTQRLIWKTHHFECLDEATPQNLTYLVAILTTLLFNVSLIGQRVSQFYKKRLLWVAP